MKNLFAASLLVVALFCTVSPVAQAQVLSMTSESSTQSSESAYDSFITSNLLTGLTPVSSVPANLGDPITGINDGAADPTPVVGPTAHETWFEGSTVSFDGGNPHYLDSDPVVTFTFNTAINTLGYTITSLQSIYGWDDRNSYSDQDYTITGTYVGGGTFSLGSVAYNPFATADESGGPQDASIFNGGITGLTGVKSLSFEFTPYSSGGTEQAGQMIREIQLFGSATEVPEPSTCALLLSGLLFTIVLSARRRRLADKA